MSVHFINNFVCRQYAGNSVKSYIYIASKFIYKKQLVKEIADLAFTVSILSDTNATN